MSRDQGQARSRSRVFVAVFAVVCLVLAAAAVYINLANPFGLSRKAESEGALETLVIETSAGPKTFRVEIADTPDEQSRGLMYRETMPADQGMLFVHPADGERVMWMKNTYLSLDMLFITAAGKVHSIAERTTPFSEETISSNGPVRAVLELNAGQAAANGVRAGDVVRHATFGNGL
jgi:uncharacterized protein